MKRRLRMRGRLRVGFSLIELMTVMLIIAALARIAVPRIRDMKRRALAVDILGDVDALRIAVINYHADSNTWPPDYGAGTVPTELISYIPQGMTFTRANYTLDWEQWTTGGASPGTIVGLKVDSPDPELPKLAAKLVGSGVASYTGGGSATFILLGVGKLF